VDLGHRLRGIKDFGSYHASRLQHPDEAWKFAHVLRSRSFALTAKPPHALWHIGLKANTRLLTIVANVDTRFKLFVDNVADGQFGLPLQLRQVYSLALFLPKEEIGERWIPGQTANMSGENARVALLHGGPLPMMFVLRQSRRVTQGIAVPR
jgi:hypothetical protein